MGGARSTRQNFRCFEESRVRKPCRQAYAPPPSSRRRPRCRRRRPLPCCGRDPERGGQLQHHSTRKCGRLARQPRRLVVGRGVGGGARRRGRRRQVLRSDRRVADADDAARLAHVPRGRQGERDERARRILRGARPRLPLHGQRGEVAAGARVRQEGALRAVPSWRPSTRGRSRRRSGCSSASTWRRSSSACASSAGRRRRAPPPAVPRVDRVPLPDAAAGDRAHRVPDPHARRRAAVRAAAARVAAARADRPQVGRAARRPLRARARRRRRPEG